ncbi:MAG: TadE/TadG family type IV pilus assembly protein [Alphaproteobacteria bacterium]
MNRLWSHARRRFRREDGTAAVELAILTPVFLTMLLGLADYGLITYYSLAMGSSARAGAQYALRNSTDTAGIEAVVKATTTLPANKLTVVPSTFCECPNHVAVACAATCVGGVVNAYVKVEVTQQYTSLFPIPLIPTPYTITETAILRIR